MNVSRLEEFWHYRELFYLLASRDIKIRYKQTLLGVVWVMLQPLSSMLVFSFLFGRVAGLPSDGSPHSVFYLAALLPWTYFSTTLGLVGNSLVTNSGLLTKVYFPRAILPSAVAIAGLLDFAIGSLCLLGVMLYHRIEFSWAMALWPFMVALLFLFTLGSGMALAALNVRYRDVKYVIPFGIQLLLFLTPIIYPASMLPERYRFVFGLNPLTGIVEGFRYCVTPDKALDWQLLGLSVVVTLVLLAVGIGYFRTTERTFADIV